MLYYLKRVIARRLPYFLLVPLTLQIISAHYSRKIVIGEGDDDKNNNIIVKIEIFRFACPFPSTSPLETSCAHFFFGPLWPKRKRFINANINTPPSCLPLLGKFKSLCPPESETKELPKGGAAEGKYRLDSKQYGFLGTLSEKKKDKQTFL